MNFRISFLALAVTAITAAACIAPAAFADPMDMQQDTYQDANHDANRDNTGGAYQHSNRDNNQDSNGDRGRDHRDQRDHRDNQDNHYDRYQFRPRPYSTCVRHRHGRCVQWACRYRH